MDRARLVGIGLMLAGCSTTMESRGLTLPLEEYSDREIVVWSMKEQKLCYKLVGAEFRCL